MSIRRVEQARDDKIATLERRIEQIGTAAHTETEQIRQRQAIAVWHISDAGRTLDQIAELLEISSGRSIRWYFSTTKSPSCLMPRRNTPP